MQEIGGKKEDIRGTSEKWGTQGEDGGHKGKIGDSRGN